MQQFQFDDSVFETHFKPWLLRKLERHVDSIISDLLSQFRERLRKIALEAKADIVVTINDAVSGGIKNITITFSPALDSDD